jgi:hypothetical protein
MSVFCESAALMVGLWWNAMTVFFVALSTIYGPISLDFQIGIALSATKWPLFLHQTPILPIRLHFLHSS